MKPSFNKRILIGGVALALGIGAVASLASFGVAQGAGRIRGGQPTAQATPAAGQGRPGKGGGHGGPAAHGAQGQVTAVSGSTITLAGKNNVSITVTVSSTTTFSKPATVALADVPVGRQIEASGTLDGSTFTATSIHILEKDQPRQGQVQPNRPAGQGQRGAAQPSTTATAAQPTTTPKPKQRDAKHLVGTVSAASADSLTVAKADGSTVTVKLASGGSVHQRVSASLADVAVGSTIMAAGKRSGTTVVAQHIAILPAAK